MSKTKGNERNGQSDKSANSSYETAAPSQHNDLQESGEKKMNTAKKMKMNGYPEKTTKKKAKYVIKASPPNHGTSNKKTKSKSMERHLQPTILPEPPSQGHENHNNRGSPSKSMINTIPSHYPTEVTLQKAETSKDNRNQSRTKKHIMPTILSPEISPTKKEHKTIQSQLKPTMLSLETPPNTKEHITVQSQTTKLMLLSPETSPKEEREHKTLQSRKSKHPPPSVLGDVKSPPNSMPEHEKGQKKTSKEDKSPKVKLLSEDKKGHSNTDSSPPTQKNVSPKAKETSTTKKPDPKNSKDPLSPLEQTVAEGLKDQQAMSKLVKMSLVEKIKKENIQAGTVFINSEAQKRDEQVKKIQQMAKSVIHQSAAMSASAPRPSNSVTDIDPSPNTKRSASPKVCRITSDESIKSRSASEPRQKSSIQWEKKQGDTLSSRKRDVTTNDRALEGGTKEDNSLSSPESTENTVINRASGDAHVARKLDVNIIKDKTLEREPKEDNLQPYRSSSEKTDYIVAKQAPQPRVMNPKVVTQSSTVEDLSPLDTFPSMNQLMISDQDCQSQQITDLYSASDISLQEDDISLSTIKQITPPLSDVVQGDSLTPSSKVQKTYIIDSCPEMTLSIEQNQASRKESNCSSKVVHLPNTQCHRNINIFDINAVGDLNNTLGVVRDETATQLDKIHLGLPTAEGAEACSNTRANVPKEASIVRSPSRDRRYNCSSFKPDLMVRKVSPAQHKSPTCELNNQACPTSPKDPSKSNSKTDKEKSEKRCRSGNSPTQPISIRVVGTDQIPKMGKEKECKKKKKKKSDGCLKPSKSRSVTALCPREGETQKRRSRSEESVVEKGCRPNQCTPRCNDRCCPGRFNTPIGKGGSGHNGGRGSNTPRCRSTDNSAGFFTRISTAVGCQLQYLAGNRGRFKPPQGTGFYRPDNSTTGWLEHVCSETLSTCSESTTECQLRRERKRRKDKKDDEDTDSQVDTMPHDDDDKKHSNKSARDSERGSKKANSAKGSSKKGGKRSTLKSSQDSQAVEKQNERQKSSTTSYRSQQSRDSVTSSRKSSSRRTQEMEIIEETSETYKVQQTKNDTGKESTISDQQPVDGSRRSSVRSSQQKGDDTVNIIRDSGDDMESYRLSIRSTREEIESNRQSSCEIQNTIDKRVSSQGPPSPKIQQTSERFSEINVETAESKCATESESLCSPECTTSLQKSFTHSFANSQPSGGETCYDNTAVPSRKSYVSNRIECLRQSNITPHPESARESYKDNVPGVISAQSPATGRSNHGTLHSGSNRCYRQLHSTTSAGPGRQVYISVPAESVKESTKSNITPTGSVCQSRSSHLQESVKESIKRSTMPAGCVRQLSSSHPPEPVKESTRCSTAAVGPVRQCHGSMPQDSIKESIGDNQRPSLKKSVVPERIEDCASERMAISQNKRSRRCTYLNDPESRTLCGVYQQSERVCNDSPISSSCTRSPGPISDLSDKEAYLSTHPQAHLMLTSTSGGESPTRHHENRPSMYDCGTVYPGPCATRQPCDYRSHRLHKEQRPIFRHRSAEHSTSRSAQDQISPPRKSRYLQRLEQSQRSVRHVQHACQDLTSPSADRCNWIENILRKPTADDSSLCNSMSVHRRPYVKSCAVRNKESCLSYNDSECDRMISRECRTNPKYYKRSASFSKYSSLESFERCTPHRMSKRSDYGAREKSQASCTGSCSMTSTECLDESTVQYSRLSAGESQSKSKSSRTFERCEKGSTSDGTITGQGEDGSCTASCESDGSESEKDGGEYDSSEECNYGEAGDSQCKQKIPKIKGRIVIRNPNRLRNTEICLQSMKIKMECHSYDQVAHVSSSDDIGTQCINEHQYEARNKTSNRRKHPESDSDKGMSFTHQSAIVPGKPYRTYEQYDNSSRNKAGRVLTVSQKNIDLPSESDSEMIHGQVSLPPKHLERLRMRLLPEQKIDCFQQIITPEQPTTIRTGKSEISPSGYFEDNDDGHGKKVVGKDYSFYSSDMATSITPSQVQAEYEEIRNFGKCLLDDDMFYTRKPGPPMSTSVMSKDESFIFDTDFDDMTPSHSLTVWSKDKNASSSGNNNQSSLADSDESEKGQVYYSNGIREAVKKFSANLSSLSEKKTMNETVHLDNIRLAPDMVQSQQDMFSVGDFIHPSEVNQDGYEKIRKNSFRALMYASKMANISAVKTFNLSGNDFTNMVESIESSNPQSSEDFEDRSIESRFIAPETLDVGIQVNLPRPLSNLEITTSGINVYDPRAPSHGQKENWEKDSDVSSLASMLLQYISRESSKESYIKRHIEVEKNNCVNSLLYNVDFDHSRFDKIGVDDELNCDETFNTKSFTDCAEFKHDENNATNLTYEEMLVVNNQSFQESILNSTDVSISSKLESTEKDNGCSSSISFAENSVDSALEFDILGVENTLSDKPVCCEMLDIGSQLHPVMDMQESLGGQIQGQAERRQKSRFPLKYKTMEPVKLSTDDVFNPSRFVKECLENEIENALDKVYAEICNKMGNCSFDNGIDFASSNNANQSLPSCCDESRVWERVCEKGDDKIEEPLTNKSLLAWLRTRLRQEIGKLVSKFDWSTISQSDEAVRKSSLKGSSVDFCSAGAFNSPCAKIHFCGIPASCGSSGSYFNGVLPHQEKNCHLKLLHQNKPKPKNCKRYHLCGQSKGNTCSDSDKYYMKLNSEFNESFAQFMNEMKLKKEKEIDAGHTKPSNHGTFVQDINGLKCGACHSNGQYDTYFPKTHQGNTEKNCDESKAKNSGDRKRKAYSRNDQIFKQCAISGEKGVENTQFESSVDQCSPFTGNARQNVNFTASPNGKELRSRNMCGKSRSSTILNTDPNMVPPINCYSAGSLPTAKKSSSMQCKHRRNPTAHSGGDKCTFLEADSSFIPFVPSTCRSFRNPRMTNDSDHTHMAKSNSATCLSHDFRSSFMRNREPACNSVKSQIYESLGYLNDPAEAYVRMYLSMESRSRRRETSGMSWLKPVNDKDYSYGTKAASHFINSLTRKNVAGNDLTYSDACCNPSDAVSGDLEKNYMRSYSDRTGNAPLYCGNDRSREKAKGDIPSNWWNTSSHCNKDKSTSPYAMLTRRLSSNYTYRNWNQSANNGMYGSPSQESPESSAESEEGMVVDRAPFANMCLSDVTSDRGINRSEAVLDLPSLYKKDLSKTTSERFPFLSKLKNWKKRESQYNEPRSEPIYQTPNFRRRDKEFSDFARKNLNSSGNIIHPLSRDDSVREDGEDILEGSEEDYHSAEEEMVSYPLRSSEVDAKKAHYLCPHHLTDMCNHRHFSLADECSRMQLQDLCRNCTCFLKYCQGMKREVKSQYTKATNNRERMNNTSEAICFSNNRSEQEERNIAFPFYTTLSEKCRGQPKIFKIGGTADKNVPSTIKHFVNWYVNEDKDKDHNETQSMAGSKQNIGQHISSNKVERSENCPVNTISGEVCQSIKEDPSAHGDVQNTNYKSKSTTSKCDVSIERQDDNVADISSSSYEDTEEEECDLTSIENVGYRMLKGLVESRLKESKTRNSYRETMRRSRAPLKRQISKLKRSRAINKLINDDDSLIRDKTHRVHHKGETHGDVWDSASLEDIQVPQVDKGRVRFACDKNGEWAEVGRGSYGCVYLGLLDGEIEVAIKDFYESNSYDHVIHEARMLVYLQGTGITPKFYGLRRRFDITKQPGEYCIIMEYFGDGKTLFNVLSEKIELPTTDWLDVLGQLVAGLRLIHRRNVLINDLKADNILIDLNSARKTIRYIDVGMATYKQGLTFQLPQNQMGKYNFLAPEVRDGLHTSKRSDIYSLGYMLDQIRRVAGTALNGVESVVSQCMREDPKKRPYIDEVVAKVHNFVKRPTSERSCISMSNSI